jgi:hypothetical protein
MFCLGVDTRRRFYPIPVPRPGNRLLPDWADLRRYMPNHKPKSLPWVDAREAPGRGDPRLFGWPLVQGSGLDHDSAGQNTDVWGRLHTLSQATHTDTLVVEHHKKAFAGDGVSDILGSTAKGAVADTIIGLYRERGKPDARLVVTGRDLEDEELAVRFDPTTAAWQPVDTHTGRKHEGAILEALRVRPDTISGLARGWVCQRAESQRRWSSCGTGG